MGYREYAKDYEIEYVEREGMHRPKAVRIYVGPYFRFRAAPEVIQKTKRTYLALVVLVAVLLLVSMTLDCSLTRIWYVQVPAAASCIPWLYSACALWRLWTAGERVEREHYNLLHDRMRSSSFFLMGFLGISILGTVFSVDSISLTGSDIAVCISFLLALICSVAMFRGCKLLEMEQVENPEKRQCTKE